MKNRPWVLVIGAASLCSQGAVNAQGTAGAALEEIIVTAQKRAESIQDVPISMTAVSGDMLEKAGINTLEGVQHVAPGISIATIGAGIASFTYIRGGGTNLLDASSDPSVAYFVDEVYVPGSAGLQFDLIDVARVEVLKGPQGTLFGRNAASGAVSIVTRRPESEFGANVGIEAGDYGLLVGRGALTGPLNADGTWQYRLSGSGRHRDPIATNPAGIDPGEIDTYSGRAQIEYETEPFDALFTADYYHADNGQANLFLATPFTAALLDMPAAHNAVLGDQNFRRHYLNIDSGFEQQEAWMTTGRLEWQTGLGVLTSISAYRDSRFDSFGDRDGSFADALSQRSFEQQRSHSQELRLAGEQDRWHWIAGLYYYHADTHRIDQYRFGPAMFLFPDTGGAPITDDHRIVVDSYAAFSQATFDITDRFGLTLGARYTVDEKESRRDVDWSAVGGFLGTASYRAAVDDDWSSFDPAATLQFNATTDLMFYLSYRRGFKSGGFQTLFPTAASFATTTYEPEHVSSLELGMKGEWLDGRLLVNTALFAVEMRDQQVSRQVGVTLLVENAGETSTEGVDLQVSAQLTERLRLDWSSTLQNARFDRYDPPGPANYNGNHQLRSPDFATSLTGEYVLPLGAAGELSLRGEYSYQSDTYFNEQNYQAQPFIYQPAYDLLNARISYLPANGRWEFALWGRNLADEEYCRNVIIFGTPAPGTGICSAGDPRSYGIAINFSYD